MSRDQEKNIFSRITELVSLLSNYEFEATVKSISRLTETTLEQTREDLAAMHRYGLTISPAKAAEKLSRHDSRYDDVVLMLDAEPPCLDISSPYLLFMNSTERALFEKQGIKVLKVKDTPLSTSLEVQRHISDINDAIEKNVCIRFRYTSPVTGTSMVEISPVMIHHNTTDDLWYCIAFPDGTSIHSYRLDRIRFNVHLMEDRRRDPVAPDDPRLQKMKLMWGSAFNNDEQAQHVKLRIFANTANILGKIRSDTAGRAAVWTQAEGSWIYEDDIIGMSSFRSWLMTFGSSVKVLEPRPLAEEILQSSEARLRSYETGKFEKY